MAVPEQQIHHTLRIGDVILLHSKEGKGYVFSDTLRLVDWLSLIKAIELQLSRNRLYSKTLSTSIAT